MRLIDLTLGLCLMAAVLTSVIDYVRADSTREFVDPSGEISLPDPDMFRTDWMFLGSWAVNDEDGVESFHSVYTQPESAAAFRRDGEFPNGTVLVKEVRAGHTADMTTGRISRAEDLILWFVMIKDSTDRYAGHALWAEDWGWALFYADEPEINVALSFEDDCMSCHEPAAETDWVYSDGYAVLND